MRPLQGLAKDSYDDTIFCGGTDPGVFEIPDWITLVCIDSIARRRYSKSQIRTKGAFHCEYKRHREPTLIRFIGFNKFLFNLKMVSETFRSSNRISEFSFEYKIRTRFT